MRSFARLACTGALALGASLLTAQTPATTPATPQAAVAPTASAPNAKLVGDWGCQVTYQGSVLPVVLHLTTAKDGSLTASMDDVTGGGAQVDASITVKDSAIHIEVPSLPTSFDGKLNDASDAIDGSWSYNGENIGCTLSKAAAGSGQ